MKKGGETITGFNDSKIDKIKMYNWKLMDKPGKFESIEKEELFVDHSYQRSIWNVKKMTQMASEWSWVLCGTLTVAIRDNRWWVIDGATRKGAADKRSDIKKLPCMVYDLAESVPREALTFVGSNNNRHYVLSCDRFKALIRGEDTWAVGLNDLFKSTGHIASRKGGIKSIFCLLTIWKLYLKDVQLMTDLWPLIADVNDTCHIRDLVVRAIYGTEIQARKQGLTLTRNPYRTFLLKKGGELIHSEIKKEKVIVGRGGMRIEANALIKFMNKQRGRGIEKIKVME